MKRIWVVSILLLAKPVLARPPYTEGFHLTTTTIAGKFGWNWTGPGKIQLILNNAVIGESFYEPEVKKRFVGIPPYEEIFLLKIYPYGSSYATQGNLQFLGIKKDGSHFLSKEVEYDEGEDPIISTETDRIDLVLPGGQGSKGSYAPPQVWTFTNGKLYELVAPEDSLFNYENRFDLIVRPSTVSAHIGEVFTLFYIIRNNVNATLGIGAYCPPWVTDNEVLQSLADPECAHPEEVAQSHTFDMGPFGYVVGELKVKVNKAVFPPKKFKIGFNAAPYRSFTGKKWSNEVRLNLE